MGTLKRSFQELRKYPSAIVGLIVVVWLIGMSIFAVIKIPYNEAIALWRGGEETWYAYPKLAAPAWTNWFSAKKLPESFILNSKNPQDAVKEVVPGNENSSSTTITYNFDFEADEFPQDLILYFTSTYKEKQPFVSVSWKTPDGRSIRIGDFGISRKQTFRISQDEKLIKRLKGVNPQQGLFNDPNAGTVTPLKGNYQLIIQATSFEPDSTVDAEFVQHGMVYGIAGTDNQRRDLTIPLLWGFPIALIFGFAASIGTSVLTMVISAVGAWFGGFIDGLIQRITEVNMVLPFLSILIMVGTFYSRSLWVILSVTILLSIFTGSIKSYRSIFMQVKNSPYIEAARAYGASDFRIIFTYMIPRMIPMLIPVLVSSIPSYVFLEASLAVLGLGDPVLPTWGKVINDAQVYGALYKGYYYWILEPAVLLMITGLGFAMLGFALDRVFNPRLRGE